MNFEEVESGLYLFRNRALTITDNKFSGYSYLLLTKPNTHEFTKKEMDKARLAKDLHRAMGFPSYKRFLWLLKNKMVQDTNVTLDDTKRASHVYGEEVATIKGKTIQKKQHPAEYQNSVKLPNTILNKYNKVHLMVDDIFIQGIQFLTTISHELKCRTAKALPYTFKKGAKREDILRGIQKVIKLYQCRG